MSGSANLPVSALIKQGAHIDDGDGKRRTKDEYRKMKDLEEQRKAGTAPAMVDIETGMDINPHIPEFIGATPWYVPTAGPTLKHQRPHPERQKQTVTLDEWYPKGTTGRVAVKYRRGACENCGAMGHSKKDCFERPRPVGAVHTDEVIAADDFKAPELGLTFDAKRDRWAGYDPGTYKHVVKEYEQMEETRKLIKAEQLKDGLITEEQAAAVEEEAPVDEDMYADDAAPAQSVDMDSRTRITVRNLRIREDTAKYLYNLDPNGPYYDPKSRSMRENPFQNIPGKESEAAKFSGENFVRYTGEVAEANQAQVFAWGARTKGIDVHALAEPTKLEALRKEYEQASKHVKEDTKNSLLEKYGGEEHFKAPPKELLLAQTESYVEYNRSGKVVKGQERPAMKSRYEEDVFPNNHTFIWGSYFKNGQWGYKCCHQFLKNTYCIGERGFQLEDEMFAAAENQRKAQAAKAEKSADDVKEEEEKTKAADPSSLKSEDGDSNGPAKKTKERKDGDDTASELSSGSGASASEGEEEANEEEDKERLQEQERRKKEEKRRTKKREKRQRRKERRKNKVVDEKKPRKKRSSGSDDDYLSESGSESGSSSSESDSDAESRKNKLSKEVRKAMKKQKKELREGQRMNEMGDRKRKYHSNYEVKPPTEAELEAYNRVRIHASDPMAALLQEKGQKKRRKNEED